MRAADVTVVIPTRDRWEVLERTLAGLRAQSVGGFETIVVCDGTDQRIPDQLRSAPGVQVLEQHRAGPGAARNVGVRATGRPLVLLLGDDTIPLPDLVERHLERHHTEPAAEVAILGRVRWHPEVARGRIMRWMEWSDAQFDYGTLERLGSAEAGFGRFYASNVSLKRELFIAAGGFDPLFESADYEDLDLGFRLHQLGMRLLYEPRAVAHHLHRHDLASVERRYRLRAGAERRMAAKHEWFTPWFHDRIAWHASQPAVSRVWPALVDLVPRRLHRLRSFAERKADRWYHQRLAPHFIAAWEGERELEELREYLGERYDHSKLVNWLHVVDEELTQGADEAGLYRTSEMYLYSLTGFAMTPTKEPYRKLLRSLVKPGAHLLDYGCGIGSDGLRLLEAGYEVAFADFDNPSLRYLRWRLTRRGLNAEVYELGEGVPSGFDAAFAFDVIEHVDDPFTFLAELERRAVVVVINLLEPIADDSALHRELPIPSILGHARRRGLLHHEHHGRSQLIAYRGDLRAATPASSTPAGQLA